MNQFELYVALLGLIVIVGVLGRRLTAPTPLLLVVAGMLISMTPNLPSIELNPDLVFNIFLPLLVYESSAYTSWRDVKSNKRPIALLSIGHVVFITIIVAIIAHKIIPGLSWPLAFVLGAVISPPDDVAIFSIADIIHLPKRIEVILEGESLLNDATALTIFRLSLAAVLTGEFSILHAGISFILIVIGETVWGIIVGNLIGQARLRIKEPMLQMLVSILTPFIAYIPAVKMGGSGVLATVVAGLIIGHLYLHRLTPGARLLWHAVWETIGFTTSSILFLLVGLNFHHILTNISTIPTRTLLYYGVIITSAVIIGRFIWVFFASYSPRLLFPAIRKQDPLPPWQYPFVISWAGMRGGVSLAAVLAIPVLGTKVDDTHTRDLLIFLVFCVITGTLLLQGLTLPWLLQKLGVDKIGQKEKNVEHFDEFAAKAEMAKTTLKWLKKFKSTLSSAEDAFVLADVELQIQEYQTLLDHIATIIKHFDHYHPIAKAGHHHTETFVLTKIIEIERKTLSKLWRKGKISFAVRNKLIEELDLRAKRFMP